MNIKEHQRIVVVGNSGSGKSYLSKKLSLITGIPVTHLDCEYWKPGWQPTPKDEWIARQKKLVAGDRWIIEGTYGSTLELRFAAADLVIFVDVNWLVCMISVLRRHGKKRSDLPDYLEEKLDADFLELPKTILRFRKKGKKTILRMNQTHPAIPFLRLKGRRAVRWFLRKQSGKP